jgi:hypothetical protein
MNMKDINNTEYGFGDEVELDGTLYEVEFGNADFVMLRPVVTEHKIVPASDVVLKRRRLRIKDQYQDTIDEYAETHKKQEERK